MLAKAGGTAIDPNRFYRTEDPELRVIGTRGTLRQWRSEGRGPSYHKIGHRCLYKGSDLIEWISARRVDPALAHA